MRHGVTKSAKHAKVAKNDERRGPEGSCGALRPGVPCRSLAILATLATLAVPCRAAELLTEDGVWTHAAPADVELSDGRITVGKKTVPVDRVIALRFQGTAAAVETVENGIVLGNGDLLVGTVERLQAGKIDFLSDSFGPVSLAVESVRAFSFEPRGVLDLSESGAGPAGAELANGDFVRGEVAFVNSRTVGVISSAKTGRRVVRIPRKRTAIVRLGPLAGEDLLGQAVPPKGRAVPGGKGSGSLQLVRLVNGDRLTGSLKRLTEDVLELDTAFVGTVKVPLAMVVELWSEGGPLVPVSTMLPVEVRQTPQFDESFPHRLDRSLAGTFLSVGGKRFERGLGCHSRCELEYDLVGGGRFSLFIAEIGMDDSVGGRGEAVFRVLVDGKTAFESSPVRAGAPPRTVRVSVRKRKRIRLVVDFGPDGSSVGDHAVWGRAVLVRK